MKIEDSRVNSLQENVVQLAPQKYQRRPPQRYPFLDSDKDRNCTDIVCTLIGLLFGTFMLIMAFVLMKKCTPPFIQENYYKSNYPTDSDFVPCAYGPNEKYPMVYFPDVSDITKVTSNFTQRVCVSVCPNQGDK